MPKQYSVLLIAALLSAAAIYVDAASCADFPPHCQHGGTCVDIPGNYMCLCTDAYAGPRNCAFDNKCSAAHGYCVNEPECGTDPNESGGTGNSGGATAVTCCHNGGTCSQECDSEHCDPPECACTNFWTGIECCVCPVGYCGDDCELEGEACPGYLAPATAPDSKPVGAASKSRRAAVAAAKKVAKKAAPATAATKKAAEAAKKQEAAIAAVAANA